MPTSTSLAPLQLVTPVLPTGTSVLSIDASILPFVINADQNTTRIEVGIYNTTQVTTVFALVDSFNQFSLSVPLTTSVAETNVTVIGRNYNPNFAWQPGAGYAVGTRFADPNSNVQLVVQASGISSSTGSVITATSLVNNVLTVTCGNQFSVGQAIVLTNTAEAVLNSQTVYVASLVGPGPTFTGFTATFIGSNFTNLTDSGLAVAQPIWSKFAPTTGTQVTVASGAVTIAAVNSFAPGQLVYLTGFTNATFLNGQVVSVSSATPFSFTAPLAQPNYSTQADSGTVDAATSDSGLVWANIGGTAVTPTVRFTLLFAQSNLSAAIAPPSGISALKNQTDCTLQWVTPDFPGFIGVRVQISTDPAGVNPPYTQYGDLVTDISSTSETVITSSSSTSVNVPTATISNVVLSNNLATIVAQNSFVPGMVVEIENLANALFLNGEQLTILTANSNGFTSQFTATNYGNAITATSISGNVLTVTAQNSYTPGQQVVISGTDEAYLNGQVLTVLLTGLTPFSFQAVFVSPNYNNPSDTGVASIADNGTATSIISTSTTETANTSMLTNYSTVDIPFSTINANEFYALFSTVIQDPTTNIVYESVDNGPLLCGYVNLKVASPTDFPVLQRKEDIAGRLIQQINKQLPDLDLSPRSEVRDIFVDPFSIEVANMSVREWFARVSTSISAISQVDNASGNGISDPFQSSPYKQQIARAYGLSPQNTQNLINEQFDLLGEQAGLTRLGATQSTVVLTFYTYQQPTSSITIPEGAVVSTNPDSTTTALNFVTQGQGTIDITNLASFYNTNTGWWGVSVPAQASQPGSIGNVGAGTIRQNVSGVPSGINVTNLVGAAFGQDQESNSAFAARIQARLVTGIDSSSANGYLVTALSTPGVIDAQVVAAGDLEMLRDWDPTRQKHVFGAVDIYTRGTTFSQNDEFVPFSYGNNGTYGSTTTYSPVTYQSGTTFQITGFNSLAYPPYDGVELYVNSVTLGTFYLSLDRAQFNESLGYIILNPGDLAYQYVGSGITQAKVPLVINTNNATNQTAISKISAAPGSYTLGLFMRLESPFVHTPDLQPVLQVYSVTGAANGSGVLPAANVTLVHTSDFLLNGGSNNAGDLVQVALTSAPTMNTVTVASLSAPTLIDIAMDQPLDSNGNPLNVASVRSLDLSTLYQYGTDYNIVALGPYHEYGIQPLTSSVAITALQVINNTTLVVTAANDFGVGATISFSGITDPTLGPILNGTSTFVIATASPTQFTGNLSQLNYGPVQTSGTATGSAIQVGQQVIVGYNKFVLYERLNFVQDESQVLSGTIPTALDNDGFVYNTWLPQSYSTGVFNSTQANASNLPPVPPFTFNPLALILDGWNGNFGNDGGLDVIGSLAYDSSGLVGNQVAYASRYIKVTYFNGVSNVVMKEGIDFTLTVDPTSGSATLARILTGHIPDGATVQISYFTTETFTVSTQYPTFVEILANTITQSKSAAADVLIKAMVANPVDITMTVTLSSNTSAETVDPVIRTAINVVLDNSSTTLFQSELISQVQAVTGVQSVEVPLAKCAKSDDSYDIGVVIPTATAWTRLTADPLFAGMTVPANSWITTNPVLPDSTIPSGGEPTAIVDFLYQGQVFQRQSSITDFLANAVVVPHLAVNPGIVDSTPGSFYIIGDNDQIFATTITATSIASSVLTVTCANSFNVGQLVQLNGTGEAFLNGQSVTIASVITDTNGHKIGFTAPFMEGNYTNASDTGTVGIPSSYAQKVVVTIPADVPNPGNLPYFCTYQVFDEGGAKDVTVSATEYLSPGTITISYVTATG
jgi:hypothetical protein